MTSSILGGIVTPPLPLVIIRHFLATPPHRACNSRETCFRDKTAYVGFLTIVEVPSQPVAAMSVTILPIGTYSVFFWLEFMFFCIEPLMPMVNRKTIQ